jgi:UDP-N-acetylmuramoylalanine-D-glutamate ligase
VVAGVGRAGLAAAVALADVAGAGAIVAWDGLDREKERAARRDLARLGIASAGGDGIALLERSPAPRSLVKSPGLAPSTPLIRAAIHRGLEVVDEAELGWRIDTRPFVAITGTNGKSTTVSLVAAWLTAAGLAPVTAGNTTFGPALSAARAHAGDVVVAELSSFQLEGCPSLFPDAALLTNLSEDHLYRHGTLAEYGACKRRLFIRDGRCVPAAAVGVDEPFGRSLAEELAAMGARVVRFGSNPVAEVRVIASRPTEAGSEVYIAMPFGERRLRTRLVGAHNAANVAGSLALAYVLGADLDSAAGAVAAAPALPGRFERVESGLGIDVVVDFAHNPDGIARVLDAGRELLALRRLGGRLIAVVSALGLVGDQQAWAMGAAARARADHLILTTQRWLPSEPSRVVPGLREGAESVTGATLAIEPDRRAAIVAAFDLAKSGDLLMILERGDRAGELYGPDDVPVPFDDRQIARDLTAERVKRADSH